MLNVLFSATRQWNPGDEFILFGCVNALRSAGADVNPIVFNRHPQIRRMRPLFRWFRNADDAIFGGRAAPFLDNSFKDTTDPSIVDLVVFAGSPEWRGKRLKPLYELIDRRQVPALFLGIGSANDFELSDRFFSATEMRVLRAARIIACRDRRTT
ncbi:MAG TPA: hypothetical protein VE967_08890, partial [Gemmatimonadaceae bacterium]|nr:hypothetical protein [Gemmatimonadaceae bacterium]